MEEHRRIPRRGIAEEVGIGQDQAEGSPTAFAEPQQKPALWLPQGRVSRFNEWDNELLHVTGLPRPWIAGVVAEPRLLFESHLDDNEFVEIVGIHLLERPQPVPELRFKARLDG